MSATQRSHDFSAPTARIQFSTTRGQHAGQPPTLLTALGSAYNQGLDAGVGSQTPLSTTSLSSPFSIHQTSAYPPSPGAAMRGTSPLAVRGPSNFNPPYNPQQWGPLGSSSNSPLEAATRSRQLGQSARVPRFAARPAGPDGIQFERCCSCADMLMNYNIRACCISPPTVLATTRRGFGKVPT